jgi:hypothetical protein
MLCAPSVARLVARLCAPSAVFAPGRDNGGGGGDGAGVASYVRVAPRLAPDHVALLLAAAEAGFGGRVHATARGLLDHAMQADLLGAGGWALPSVSCPFIAASAPVSSVGANGDGESEHVLFRLQIARLHLEWLQVLQAERGTCGIDAILRSILTVYTRMQPHELDSLVRALARQGDIAPARPAKLYDPLSCDESAAECCRHLVVDNMAVQM